MIIYKDGVLQITPSVGSVGSSQIIDGAIVNADVNAAAAIAYSKLNLSASIVNADVAAAAAIAATKIASSGLPWETGKYYTSPIFIGAESALTLTANRIYGISLPMGNRDTHTFTEIGIRCSTSIDGAKVRLGIYNDNNGVPGTLLLDCGEFTCSGTGAQDIKKTISQQLITQTNYWLALVSDSAIAVNGCATTSVGRLMGGTAYADTRDITGGFAAFTYGALSGANPFPTRTATNGSVPVVKLLA